MEEKTEEEAQKEEWYRKHPCPEECPSHWGGGGWGGVGWGDFNYIRKRKNNRYDHQMALTDHQMKLQLSM